MRTSMFTCQEELKQISSRYQLFSECDLGITEKLFEFKFEIKIFLTVEVTKNMWYCLNTTVLETWQYISRNGPWRGVKNHLPKVPELSFPFIKRRLVLTTSIFLLPGEMFTVNC